MKRKSIIRIIGGAMLGLALMIGGASSTASACWNCVQDVGCSYDGGQSGSYTCQGLGGDACKLTQNDCNVL